MYIYIYVYMYVCMHACMHACMYAYVSMYIHTHTHASTCTHQQRLTSKGCEAHICTMRLRSHPCSPSLANPRWNRCDLRAGHWASTSDSALKWALYGLGFRVYHLSGPHRKPCHIGPLLGQRAAIRNRSALVLLSPLYPCRTCPKP